MLHAFRRHHSGILFHCPRACGGVTLWGYQVERVIVLRGPFPRMIWSGLGPMWPSLLRQAGLELTLGPRPACEVTAGTFFLARGDHVPVSTTRGMRPGSSWADVLFAIVIRRVLERRKRVSHVYHGTASEALILVAAAIQCRLRRLSGLMTWRPCVFAMITVVWLPPWL